MAEIHETQPQFDVTYRPIYSAVKLCRYASGEYPLFQSPLGQTLISSDADERERYDERYTNLREAGRLGHSFGDAHIDKISVYLTRRVGTIEGGDEQDLQLILERCSLVFKIATMEYVAAPLKTFFDHRDVTPYRVKLPELNDAHGFTLDKPIAISAYDNIEARLKIHESLRITGQVIVTCVLHATCRREIR
jgi:hypothetical protein